jgi:hypothetical protein
MGIADLCSALIGSPEAQGEAWLAGCSPPRRRRQGQGGFEDIVALMDATAPKPDRPKAYRKKPLQISN